MDKQFLSFEVSKEFLKEIDRFRFENYFNSRAEAIRWLLKYALEQKPKP